MNSSILVDNVRAQDLQRVAEMMHADMLDLERNVELKDLLALCHAAYKEAQAECSGTLFLAARLQKDQEPVGMLLAWERMSVRIGANALWVEELYVDPKARMGGIGRVLVVQALRIARARGLKGVDLEAYRMNTGASILYRSIGFQRLARERYTIELDSLDWDR